MPTMKTLLLSTAAAVLLLSAGCANTSTHSKSTNTRGKPPMADASVNADLLIISAVYGSGTKFADVTYRVNDLLRQPGVEFFARPEWLKVDPTPGWNKALVIVYEVRGQRHNFTAGEGGKVSAQLLLLDKTW
jgi:hypothetical protein